MTFVVATSMAEMRVERNWSGLVGGAPAANSSGPSLARSAFSAGFLPLPLNLHFLPPRLILRLISMRSMSYSPLNPVDGAEFLHETKSAV